MYIVHESHHSNYVSKYTPRWDALPSPQLNKINDQVHKTILTNITVLYKKDISWNLSRNNQILVYFL